MRSSRHGLLVGTVFSESDIRDSTNARDFPSDSDWEYFKFLLGWLPGPAPTQTVRLAEKHQAFLQTMHCASP